MKLKSGHVIAAFVSVTLVTAVTAFISQSKPLPVSWIMEEKGLVPSVVQFVPTGEFRDYLASAGLSIQEVERLPSDLAKVVAIMTWAHSRWEHDGSNNPGTSDPKAILESAKSGKRFRCVEYSVITVAAARALGLQARVVGIRRPDVETAWSGAGHVVAEIFLGDVKKWIMVDSQWARIPVTGSVPLGAAEFSKVASSGSHVMFVFQDGQAHEDSEYLSWVKPYLYYIAFRLDQRFGENKDSLDQVMLIPQGAKVPEKFQGEPIPGKVFPSFATRTLYGIDL